MENKTNKEIDFRTLLDVFVRFWVLILVMAVALAAVGFAFATLTGRTLYVGRVSFWVKNSSSVNQMTESALRATQYAELVDSDILCRRAVKAGDLVEKWGVNGEDEAVSLLKQMVSASKSNEDSVKFTVKVTAADAETALAGIKAVQQAMLETVADVNGENDTQNYAAYITVIDQPTSTHDITPVQTRSQLRYTAIMAVVGLCFGYIVAFCLYFFRRRVYVAADAAAVAPVIGTIPAVKLGMSRSGDIAAELPHAVSEAFDILAAGLTKSGEHSVIGVVPTAPSIGADYVGYNIAAAAAGNGKSVLYVSTSHGETDGSSATPVTTDLSGMKSRLVEYSGERVSAASITAAISDSSSFDLVVVCAPAPSDIVGISTIADACDAFLVTVRHDQLVKDAAKEVDLLVGCGAKVVGSCFVE